MYIRSPHGLTHQTCIWSLGHVWELARSVNPNQVQLRMWSLGDRLRGPGGSERGSTGCLIRQCSPARVWRLAQRHTTSSLGWGQNAPELVSGCSAEGLWIVLESWERLVASWSWWNGGIWPFSTSGVWGNQQDLTSSLSPHFGFFFFSMSLLF